MVAKPEITWLAVKHACCIGDDQLEQMVLTKIMLSVELRK